MRGRNERRDRQVALVDREQTFKRARIKGKTDVDLSCPHQAGNGLGACNGDRELDAWILGSKACQEIGKQGDGNAFHGSDAYLAALQAAQGVDGRKRILIASFKGANGLQKNSARFR